MRKRRRLADKLTIMVCAVLVAVSAFFYAPMDVQASELVTLNTSVDYLTRNRYICEGKGLTDSVKFDFSPYLSGDGLYKVTVDFTAHYQCVTEITSEYCYWRNVHTVINTFDSAYDVPSNSSTHMRDFQYSENGLTLYIDSDNPVVDVTYYFTAVFVYDVGASINFAMGYDFSSISVEKVTSADSSDYQDGYNAGYSAGEQAGYGNGYSNGFADGEASVDTDSIYDQAFQAGKDSVDTESYYDAGFQAGYQVAYSEGYECGYDSGYQDAMDRIANWGADTSDYPILVYNKNLSDVSCTMEVVTNMPSVGHGQVNLCNLDININPSHTYKIVFDSVYPSTSVGDLHGSMNEQFNYNIGLFSIPWSGGESFGFVQGSSLSSVFRLEVYDYSAHYYEIGGENDVFQPWDAYRIYSFDSIDVFVYDMGPSGDTQNHIANQTDKLTNGFNDSKGNSVNNDFLAGLNDFETAEDSLFATATNGLKDFTFFDFQSVPAMVTGMSFVGSIMSGWFTQAGGASGVGIVLSILFSIMLVAMVLGLYRWYQSKGGKD